MDVMYSHVPADQSQYLHTSFIVQGPAIARFHNKENPYTTR